MLGFGVGGCFNVTLAQTPIPAESASEVTVSFSFNPSINAIAVQGDNLQVGVRWSSLVIGQEELCKKSFSLLRGLVRKFQERTKAVIKRYRFLFRNRSHGCKTLATERHQLQQPKPDCCLFNQQHQNGNPAGCGLRRPRLFQNQRPESQ